MDRDRGGRSLLGTHASKTDRRRVPYILARLCRIASLSGHSNSRTTTFKLLPLTTEEHVRGALERVHSSRAFVVSLKTVEASPSRSTRSTQLTPESSLKYYRDFAAELGRRSRAIQLNTASNSSHKDLSSLWRTCGSGREVFLQEHCAKLRKTRSAGD